MEWVFGPDDDKAYQKASDDLIKRFSAWTKTHKGDWLADDARIALDWKWGYGEGHLVTWTLPDFDEFLLKWFPRKVSISGRQGRGSPPSSGVVLHVSGR